MADLVIANGRVVDGTGERPAFLADVAVSKRTGKIVEVGCGLVAKYPRARIVDAVGKYITPGFVDIHTFVFYQCPHNSLNSAPSSTHQFRTFTQLQISSNLLFLSV